MPSVMVTRWVGQCSVVVKDWLLEDKNKDLRSEDEDEDKDKDSNFKYWSTC